MKLISIIVPIYNTDKYLEKCINSILNQTYTNIEIILVDDGSTDKSGEICDKYEKNDNRIKVIHKKNGGSSDAKNVGIKISRGEYIGFIDSDDYVEKEMYEFLYNNLDENNCDISISGRFVDYEDGTSEVRYSTNIKMIMNNRDALIKLNSYVGFDVSPCDRLFKAELFNQIEFPFGTTSEDYYIMYKLFAKAKRIVFDSKPMYHYYQRENSCSRNSKYDDSFIRASESQINFFKQYYPDLLLVAKTSYVFANIALYNKMIVCKSNYPKHIKKALKNNVKKNVNFVYGNPYISKLRKIQVFVFSKSLIIYMIIKKAIDK